LKEHACIEPNATVSDDFSLSLGRDPTNAILEVSVIWRLSRRWGSGRDDDFSGGDVEVFAPQIIPPGSTMIDTH
jgi:hypothetical protein